MSKEVFSSWNQVMTNVKKYLPVENIQKTQDNIKQMIADLQDDFNQLVDKDVKKLKQRFLSEKKEIELLLNKTINSELNKAQKYVETQKKELLKLQKKIESYIKKEKLKAKKKIQTKLKKTSKKKVTRKATKKTAKNVATKMN